MGGSEVWGKYHEHCGENGKIARGDSRVQFAILTTMRVVFTPNFTPIHAITN